MRLEISWASVVVISLVVLGTHFHGAVARRGHVKGLREGFYNNRDSCPQAYKLVKDITQTQVQSNPALPAKLLRLHFHDCFVRGCDASVLLDGNKTEKAAIPNLSLGGFEVIDAIKTKLEEVCPGKVSCADILALSARDAVSFQYKEDLWKVLTGRRDGVVSLASEVDLPSPFANFTTLLQQFRNKRLNVVDLVALSGAHTIGVAHCGTFTKRLYNFTGKGDADPSLDATYADTLRKQCPNPPVDRTTTVEMDPQDSTDFNTHYYDAVTHHQGLFQSDAALLTDGWAAVTVLLMKNPAFFFHQFAESMMKMGSIGVITGYDGEIRNNCRLVN